MEMTTPVVAKSKHEYVKAKKKKVYRILISFYIIK